MQTVPEPPGFSAGRGEAAAPWRARSRLLASAETIGSSNAPLRAANLWIRFGTIILLGLIES